jgi:hypothetical protein
VICSDNRFTQSARHDLSNIAQDDRRVNVNNVRISFFQKPAKRQNRQEWNADIFVGGPFERREAMGAYFVLDTVDIAGTDARGDNPYLVSTIDQVNSKSLGDCWNAADHGRILISNDHYAHVYRSFPA